MTQGGTTRTRRRGAGGDGVRKHNLAAVLERIHLAGPVSRSELTTLTGLNRSTIADLVGELASLGLVEEERVSTTTGPGRPSPVVQPRPEGATALAVELAVDSIAVSTMGLGGHVFNTVRVARPRGRFSPEETVQNVAKLASPLVASLPGNHVLAGVGAAVVGITRRQDGFVHLAPNLEWRDVPLGAMLAEAMDLKVPVYVANEADLGALGEHRFGLGVGLSHLIYVSGEVGIGVGIILDGRPVLGSAGYAGEAGHTLINPEGQECRCGARGCWETEAGEAALLRHAGTPVGVTRLDAVNELVNRATEGDEKVLRAVDEVGRWLGLGIGDLINLFNPELVVMGGLYHRLFPFLEHSLLQGMRSRALAAPTEMVRVARSGLGTDAPLIGASELVFSQVIADPARRGQGQRAEALVEGGTS